MTVPIQLPLHGMSGSPGYMLTMGMSGVYAPPGEIDLAIEKFEFLRLGTTMMRDLRVRAGAALADTTDALLDLLERLRLGGSRMWHDLKVRAGTWQE